MGVAALIMGILSIILGAFGGISIGCLGAIIGIIWGKFRLKRFQIKSDLQQLGLYVR